MAAEGSTKGSPSSPNLLYRCVILCQATFPLPLVEIRSCACLGMNLSQKSSLERALGGHPERDMYSGTCDRCVSNLFQKHSPKTPKKLGLRSHPSCHYKARYPLLLRLCRISGTSFTSCKSSCFVIAQRLSSLTDNTLSVYKKPSQTCMFNLLVNNGFIT